MYGGPLHGRIIANGETVSIKAAYLRHEMLELRRTGVDVVLHGRGVVGQRVPRWLVTVHVHGVMARTVVADGRRGDHGHAAHLANVHLATVLASGKHTNE